MALLDEFPSTHRTFIVRTLQGGDLELARNHVMSRAYLPLCIYARASSLRSVAEPEDLVGNFFATRFGRDDYLPRWVEQPRALPLRRWLVNGLILTAREMVADGIRTRRLPVPQAFPRTIEPAPWIEFERRWRHRLLELACDRVSAQLDDEGRPEAWTLFVQHVIAGKSYVELAPMTGIRPHEAPMVTRTITRRLRAALAQLLGQEIGDTDDIARELGAILRGGD